MPAQIDDPALLDRILRAFRIKGRIRPFDLSETAIPVFEIGNLAGLDPTVVTTKAGSSGIRIGMAADAYLASGPIPIVSGDVFSSKTVNPTLGEVVLDTDELTAGTHLMNVEVGWDAAGVLAVEVQWRNAANDGTRATWHLSPAADGSSLVKLPPLSPFFAVAERIRIVTPAAGTGTICCNITVRATNLSEAL